MTFVPSLCSTAAPHLTSMLLHSGGGGRRHLTAARGLVAKPESCLRSREKMTEVFLGRGTKLRPESGKSAQILYNFLEDFFFPNLQCLRFVQITSTLAFSFLLLPFSGCAAAPPPVASAVLARRPPPHACPPRAAAAALLCHRVSVLLLCCWRCCAARRHAAVLRGRRRCAAAALPAGLLLAALRAAAAAAVSRAAPAHAAVEEARQRRNLQYFYFSIYNISCFQFQYFVFIVSTF